MVEVSERIRSQLGIGTPATPALGPGEGGDVAGNGSGDEMTALDDEPISLD
jgi:hypothetical protein